MSARDEREGGTAMGQATETGHRAHPTADVYVRVFFVLGILTLLEAGLLPNDLTLLDAVQA